MNSENECDENFYNTRAGCNNVHVSCNFGCIPGYVQSANNLGSLHVNEFPE